MANVRPYECLFQITRHSIFLTKDPGDVQWFLVNVTQYVLCFLRLFNVFNLSLWGKKSEKVLPKMQK